jgi:choline-sulfatase
MRDILVFMSDQHSAEFCSWGNVRVDTPVLDEIRKNGTSYEAAYTACPLCVPARMSMLSSMLPSHTGIYTNTDALPDTFPTFAHALVAAGYETVLIGRMHFVGENQHHGFVRHLAPDITPVSWEMPIEQMRKERGDLHACSAEPWCTNIVGAGESPVMCYDRMVVETALQYLQKEHERPQFILVGTYGPHFPYVTSGEMFLKYINRVSVPPFFDPESIPSYLKDFDVLGRRIKPSEVTEQIVKGAMAAYCGLIEIMDGQIGTIRRVFQAFTEKRRSDAVFCYISDHGDTVGERRMFGKQTYFEKSARIPMLFEGTDINRGKLVWEPVSLMDIGPTVCELAGTSFPCDDGRSLADSLRTLHVEDSDRIVVSQFVESYKNRQYASAMLRWRQYKFIQYHDYEEKSLLFDLVKDPGETENIAGVERDLVCWFTGKLRERCDFSMMERQKAIHDRNAGWFKAYEHVTGYDDSGRWSGNPETARGQLDITVNSKPVRFPR